MKRNFLFDLIKIFMAYLVVVIHCTNMPNNPLTKVAVPFFFILAGFFATRQPSTPPFLQQKTLSIY